MKEVGILEIGPHFHRLYALCKICNAEETNVTVFTTDEGFSIAEKQAKGDLSEYDWVLKREKEGDKSFLKRVEEICNEKIDLLHVQSIIGPFKFFNFLFFNPNCMSVLWIYNARFWLKPVIPFGLSNLKLTVAHNADLLMKRWILPRYDAINVQYPPMKDYILDNTDYDKDVFSITNVVYEGSEPPKDNDIVRFTVPGAIIPKRNYKLILKVFEELFPKYEDKIELCLLGRPKKLHKRYANGVIKRCKDLEKRGYNIRYFEEWVPQEVYDDTFLRSNIIISPIRVGEQGPRKEIRGITHVGGFILDCIEYARPFIVPQGFKITEELQTSALNYNNAEELEEIVKDLMDDEEELKKLQSEAFINAKKFSLENQQERHDLIIKRILEEI